MWYAPVRVGSAPAEPITTATAKAHLVVDFTDHDTMIDRLISAARGHVEKMTGLVLASQTVDSKCDDWDDLARLNDAPITSITSVKYIDTEGAEQTLSTDVYELRLNGVEAAIVLKYNQVWPTARLGSQITVRAVVGYDAATLPSELVQAALLLVGHWYANREAVIADGTFTATPMAVDHLISNYRRFV